MSTTTYPHLVDASTAIDKWNDVRLSGPAMIQYFKEGAYFEVKRSQYQNWKNLPTQPEYIHAYLGIANQKLMLYFIDNVTDAIPITSSSAKGQFNGNLQHSAYAPSMLANPRFASELDNLGSTQLTPLEALERSTRWSLHSHAWLTQNAGSNMTQVLVIPFGDFETLFGAQHLAIDSVLMLLALKMDELDVLLDETALLTSSDAITYSLEFILWGYNKNNGIISWLPKDIVRPVPPFGGSGSGIQQSDFQLLAYAT